MKRWTLEEEELLQEYWGQMSIPSICKKLGRTRNAIMVRVQRLGLPPYLESGAYVTMNQLLLALGYGNSGGYKIKSWVENRNFPVKKPHR